MFLKRFSREVFQSRMLSKPFVSPAKILVNNRSYGVFEPDYLDDTEIKPPNYEFVNVQLKGYDFPVLEKYQKYVHNSAERFGLVADDAWATPAKKLRITKLRPESTAVETEYHLNIYERNVQLMDVPSILLPLFVDCIEAAIPCGVTMSVHPHEVEHTEIRYIPDFKLIALQEELESFKSELGTTAPKK